MRFPGMLLTERQTDEQANQQGWKDNFLCSAEVIIFDLLTVW